MSFALLKEEVIGAGLCQGCGLCVGSCKHLVMDKLRPVLKDYCILEKDGLDCGLCYNKCPQARQKKFEPREPKKLYSLRSRDPEITKSAVNGGFVTTLSKYLLETQQLESMIMVKNADGLPQAEIVTDPKDVVQHAGVAYGRSGVLNKLMEELGQHPHAKAGIVGVPCEMRGAMELETRMKTNILRIGLFCNASVRNDQVEHGNICSPCCNGCPANVNAQGYVALIRQGKYQEALDLVREQNPLPSVCGRICTHECEYACTLIGTDHPVAVRELKKFISEWERTHKGLTESSKSPKNAKKIAIIGSGPAGLTAGYYLAKMGYSPTIFEKEDKIGGMLRFGVPQFRLPEDVLNYDIEFIKRAGVELKLNAPLGPDLTFDDLKKKGYKAIFLSIGQYKPKSLHLEGEDLPGVLMAVNFLMDRKYRYWENKEEYKDKVVGILGGGPVAVDVAQTALRLGAKKVILTEIRTEPELKMVVDDIPAKELQFMEYRYSMGTQKITQGPNGTLLIKAHKVEPAPPYKKIEKSDFEIPVDAYVIAVGQDVDYSLLDAAGGNVLTKNRNKLVIDETTFETNIPGIFAGGDVVMNSKAVAIAAITHGREAAVSIDRYLRGQDLKKGRMKPARSFFSSPIKPPKDYSVKPENLSTATETLWGNFDEINGMFNEEMAVLEAHRCLSCNNFCNHCQDFPAIYADVTGGEVGSQKGFTTVIAWSDRGRDIIDAAIKDGLFEEGVVDAAAVSAATTAKAERPLIPFKKSARQLVLEYAEKTNTFTIGDASDALEMEPRRARYEILRLFQDGKLEMNAESGGDQPIFSFKHEM